MTARHARARATILGVLLTVALAGAAATGARAEYPNGAIPRAALAHIVTPHGCTLMRRDAAAAFNSMRLAGGASIGVNGCDSAYRAYARQVYWRAYWCSRGACGNAAAPGSSNHGRGVADDVPPPTRSFIDARGYRWGFCKLYHAPGCGPSDAAYESWHVKWTPGVWRQRPDPGASYAYPALREGSGGPGQSGRVMAVQRRLGLRADGELGPATSARLRAFQHRHCLAASGATTKRTWIALRAPDAQNHRVLATCSAGRTPTLKAQVKVPVPAIQHGPQDGAATPLRRSRR